MKSPMMTFTSDRSKAISCRSALEGEFLHVGAEEDQGSKARGTDGVPLGDGLGGITHCIQGVGDGPDALIHFRHFRNPAGIVGNGAVGVNGDNHTGHGQHGHGGHGNPVKPSQIVRHKNGKRRWPEPELQWTACSQPDPQ